LVAATVGWRLLGPESREPATAQAPDDALLAMPKGPLIAVLPFLHLSGDPERQYVSDGITEQLTTELARSRDLWVLPLGTVQKYKAGFVDPRELRREFGTDYALEGSVLEIGNTIRITARLIDVESARYIWVKSYDADFTPASIYEVQDAITREVVGNLAGKYGVLVQDDMARATRKAPDSLDAYDCVLRYYDYQVSIDVPRHAEVKACLQQAVALDPEYAEAWAVLANVYMQEIRFRLGPQEAMNDVMAKAKAAARRAIDLDPTDPTGHMMYSNLLFSEGDLVGFKQEGETALRLNPNNSVSVAHYGMRLSFIGEWDLGRLLIKKAVALNPGHPQWYRIPEVLYRYDRGEYQQALKELDEIDMPNFFWTHLLRAAILGQLDRQEGARVAAQSLLKLKPAFRREASSLIKVWHLPVPLYQGLVEGLGKAGLELSRDASIPTN
jgi:TolB-like protein/Flp pilus assembly protein TadD